MVPVTSWSDCHPYRRLFDSWSPRTNRAAPASRTMARANWPTMRTWRKRRWPRSPVVPREPLLSVVFRSSRRAKSAGATPKARAVKRQAPNAQPSTRQSKAKIDAAPRCRRRSRHAASQSRSTGRRGRHRRRRRRPAGGTRRTGGAAAGRARRRGRERTANSRARAIVRARRRFARLEQAMSSTKPERPTSMPMIGWPCLSRKLSSMATVRQVLSALAAGKSAARRRPKSAMKASACARVTRGGATPDEADPGGVAVARLLFREAERPEDVDRVQVAPVAEVGGQHADDLVGLAVDANRAADDLAVTAEAILPIAVADDEDAVVAQDLFVGTEAAAELRLGAEGGEEIGGDAEAVRHLGGLAGLGEAHVRDRRRRRSRRSRSSRTSGRGSRPARCRRERSGAWRDRCGPARSRSG